MEPFPFVQWAVAGGEGGKAFTDQTAERDLSLLQMPQMLRALSI